MTCKWLGISVRVVRKGDEMKISATELIQLIEHFAGSAAKIEQTKKELLNKMADLSTQLANLQGVQSALKTALAGIATGVTALFDKVAGLEANSGTPQAQADALTALASDGQSLLSQAQTLAAKLAPAPVLTPAPAEPPPPPSGGGEPLPPPPPAPPV